MQEPVLCNTLMNLLKSLGKYGVLMDKLNFMPAEVFQCLTQLCDLYLYSVFQVFVSVPLQTKLFTRPTEDMPLAELDELSKFQAKFPHLKYLQKVRLFLESCNASYVTSIKGCLQQVHSTLHWVAEKAIAVESVKCLGSVLRRLHFPLGDNSAAEFFQRIEDMAEELQTLIYEEQSPMLVRIDPHSILQIN